MPKKNLIRSTFLPYHVTARTNNRDPFFGPIDEVWKIHCHYAYEVTTVFGAEIHAFVLMPNHFHMLVSTPERDLGQVMQHFMRSVTKRLNRVTRRSGRVFGGCYHRSLIEDPVYYANAFKYVYRNPVKAEIVGHVESYRYSTLHGLLGGSALEFPLFYPFERTCSDPIPSATEDLLRWLNHSFSDDRADAIRKALKRPRFEPPKRGWNRKSDDLLSRLD